MRGAALCIIAVLLILAPGCQDITAPPAPVDDPAIVMSAALTGPSNVCYGEIIAGIASTWPWAHEGRIAFQPPPGAVALWIKTFGPDLGISSVRELQLLFCAS